MYGDSKLSESSRYSYLKRASKLQQGYATHLASISGKMITEVNIVPVDLVKWILKRREKQEISASTMRQYRSALKYFYSLFEDVPSAREAIMLLEKEKNKRYGKPKEKKTSALKSKGVSMEKHIALLSALSKSRSMVSDTAYSWVHYTYIYGLRPTEWKSVEVIKSENEGASEYYLQVVNAKTTNGPSNGKTRTFNITKLGIEEIEKLRDFVMCLRAHDQNNSFDSLLSTIRSLIAYTCKKIFPAKSKLISLYSYSHQFSANAKKQYGTEYDVKKAVNNQKTIDTKNSLFAKAAESKNKFKI